MVSLEVLWLHCEIFFSSLNDFCWLFQFLNLFFQLKIKFSLSISCKLTELEYLFSQLKCVESIQ